MPWPPAPVAAMILALCCDAGWVQSCLRSASSHAETMQAMQQATHQPALHAEVLHWSASTQAQPHHMPRPEIGVPAAPLPLVSGRRIGRQLERRGGGWGLA